MTKLKFWNRVFIGFLVVIGLLISLIPVGIYLWVISSNLVIPNINLTLFGWVVVAVILLPLLAYGYTKLIKVKWHRKLQALAVADELGVVPTTSIVVRRLLIMTEYSFAPVMCYLIVLLFSIVNAEFTQLANVFMWLLVSYGLFTIFLMITDGVKIFKMNQQKIDDEYQLQINKDELYAKRLIGKKKDAVKHARLTQKIEDLEKVLNED